MMQVPCQSSIFRPVCFSSHAPRLRSGQKRIGVSSGMLLITSMAFELVQMMSESFHAGGAVDIGDQHRPRVVRLPLRNPLGRGRVREGASGLHVRDEHHPVRIEDLGGLRHEVDPTKDDDVGVGVPRRLGELQGVPDVVSEVLNVGLLVVVSQDDGIPD